MTRQPRNPEYIGLTNERVQKAMNVIQKATLERRLSEEENLIVMPILDANFNPKEKLKRTISNLK